MKVLVATQKPFAAAAVAVIRQIVEEAGYELALLEKYADQADLVKAVADAKVLQVVIDKSAVVYGGTDITQDVIRKMAK